MTSFEACVPKFLQVCMRVGEGKRAEMGKEEGKKIILHLVSDNITNLA